MGARSSQTVVIVGGGAAGGQAALTLRRIGFGGKITLIGAERLTPYERPPLSKDTLTRLDAAEPVLLAEPSFFAEQGVALDLGTPVVGIEPQRHAVFLADGRAKTFDHLLIATGASVRRLDVPGETLEGVHYLRTFQDSLSIRRELEPGNTVVVIGGGLIGLEVAASARRRNARVTVVEAAKQLMCRTVPEPISDVFARKHEREGVEVRLGARPVEILGTSRVAGVELDDGSRLEADVVVIGIGIVPATDLAETAGLEIEDGIVVDEYCRSSVPAILAAGDCCRQHNLGLRRLLRQEAWQSALDQGDVAAHTIAGLEKANRQVPWFWSDQYDYNLQVAGAATAVDDAVVRGNVARDDFVLFQLSNGRVVGALGVNRGKDMVMAKRLIAAGDPVDRSELVDEHIGLRRLTRRATQAFPNRGQGRGYRLADEGFDVCAPDR